MSYEKRGINKENCYSYCEWKWRGERNAYPQENRKNIIKLNNTKLDNTKLIIILFNFQIIKIHTEHIITTITGCLNNIRLYLYILPIHNK